MTEAWQNRLAVAMSDYRQVTRLAPKADIGWIALSGCAEKLGNKRESLEYARHATAVAPSSSAAWLQLSREKGFPETSRRHQRRLRVQINFAVQPANQVRDNRAVTEFTNRLENREI